MSLADLDTDVVVALIAAVSLVLGGLISVGFQWLISRGVNSSSARKLRADTADLYDQIANRAADRALKNDERITALESALATKDARIDELEAAGRDKDQKITALQCEVNELRAKVQTLEARKR